MTPKEELKQNIVLLERNIESPILQCDPHIVMISRNATRSNYEAFIRKEISEEELKGNNNIIGLIASRFIDMCSCMRESKI
jgi:hypothetical protein